MPDTLRFRIITRSGGGDRREVAPPPGWPTGEYVYETAGEAADMARQFNRACGSPTIDPYKITATYQVRRERVAVPAPPIATAQPILVGEHIPAADGQTYRVFVDVNDVELRRLVPFVVAKRLQPSIVAIEAFRIRLEVQP